MNKINYKSFFDNNDVGEIIYNGYLKDYTTFKVGGPADVIVFPTDEEEVKNIINICKKNNLKYMILGNGSNLLVKDGGIRDVIIAFRDNFCDIKVTGDEIFAESGALLKHVAEKAMENGLTGLEFAHGIPGSVGGAMTMNAGAYDSETKNVVKSVVALDSTGEVVEIPNEEMNFRYRHSRVEDEGLVVLGAVYKLNKGKKEDVQLKMDELMDKRKSKQPLEYSSAGSTFKRPEGYFAGKLIDDSGLRGLSHGDAQVSEKHCGFVINRDKASAKEILELIEVVQKTVKDKFGILLEREVKVIGED